MVRPCDHGRTFVFPCKVYTSPRVGGTGDGTEQTTLIVLVSNQTDRGRSTVRLCPSTINFYSLWCQLWEGGIRLPQNLADLVNT